MFRFDDENKNRTIESLRKFPGENAYEITYYGDYALDEFLKCGADNLRDLHRFQTKYLLEGTFIGSLYKPKHNCSGFTAHNSDGDFLLCHDLDTPVKQPIVTLAKNNTTGKTVGISNFKEYGYYIACWADNQELKEEDFLENTSCVDTENPFDCARALCVPYDMQDGMNAHGLAIVSFTAGGTEVETDGKKIPLCYNSLYRSIVDKCRNVEEALDFLTRYTLSPQDYIEHFQIADASGNSAIIEYVGGEMKVLRNEKPYQVCSNFLIYNNPEMDGFGKDRYLAYQEYLEAHNGIISEEDAFRLLHENHIPGDENYSVVFNLTKRTVAVQFAPEFAVTHRYQL